jgi:hypothetical protein
VDDDGRKQERKTPAKGSAESHMADSTRFEDLANTFVIHS